MPRKPSPLQSEASRKNGAKGRGPQVARDQATVVSKRPKMGPLCQDRGAAARAPPVGRAQQYLAHLLSTATVLHPCTLTNECVRATLIADRCASYEQATIEEQTQNERQKWRLAEKRKADRLAKELRGRPEATVPKLQSFGEGTRLMITCLEELIEDVQSQGYLPQDDLELALCLVGVAPTREQIGQDVLAYAINLFNLGCTPGASATVVAEWLKPENRPEVLQGLPVDEFFGADADQNRELLVGQLARGGRAASGRGRPAGPGGRRAPPQGRSRACRDPDRRGGAAGDAESRRSADDLSPRLECPVADARAREGGRAPRVGRRRRRHGRGR